MIVNIAQNQSSNRLQQAGGGFLFATVVLFGITHLTDLPPYKYIYLVLHVLVSTTRV